MENTLVVHGILEYNQWWTGTERSASYLSGRGLSAWSKQMVTEDGKEIAIASTEIFI